MLIDLKVLGDWKSVIGGALGFVSAIFTAFGPTIRDRNVHARRLAAYDAATKQLTYYDFWLKASLAANPSAESEFRTEMKSAIDRIQAELYQALGQLAPPAQKSKPSLIKRVFSVQAVACPGLGAPGTFLFIGGPYASRTHSWDF